MHQHRCLKVRDREEPQVDCLAPFEKATPRRHFELPGPDVKGSSLGYGPALDYSEEPA